MKKILVILLAVLVLTVASAVWILRVTGPTDPAALLPAEAVALASLPDLHAAPRAGRKQFSPKLAPSRR